MVGCVLETRPRVSGRLWDLNTGHVKSLKQNGLDCIEQGNQGKILDIKVKDTERIIGGCFNQRNEAVLWTEKGSIYKLDLGNNKYWKVGKPGIVTCADFNLNPSNYFAAGLDTGRAIIIDTMTGTIRSRCSEEGYNVQFDFVVLGLLKTLKYSVLVGVLMGLFCMFSVKIMRLYGMLLLNTSN